MDTTQTWHTLVETLLRVASIALLVPACAPATEGPAPSSSSHSACAAGSCAASLQPTAAGARAPTQPVMTVPVVPTTPIGGMASPPPPPATAQAGRAAPPAIPMAGAPATQAGRASAPPPMTSAAAGSGAGGASSAGMNLSGVSDAELDMLRQACVDQINMFRAMLPNLKPLKRASPAQEACADMGAQMDGDAMVPHQSARKGLCAKQGLSSENMCGGFQGGNITTLMNGLTLCQKGFWAEGEPSNGRAACTMDLNGCYEQHGHYLNMSDPNIGIVACAFYKTKNGSMWMNNDFGY